MNTTLSMRRRSVPRALLLTLVSFAALSVYGHVASAQSAPFRTAGTARTLAPGDFEVGVFQPLRVGVAERFEVSSHLLFSLLHPNLEAKFNWYERGGFSMASVHAVAYPTLLLRQLACADNFCLFPATSKIPHMIGVENGAMATGAFGRFDVTVKISSRVGLRNAELELPTTDLPLLYTRLAHYHDDVISGVVGVDVDGPLAGPLSFSVDVDVWRMFGRDALEGNSAVEHSGLVRWDASEHLALFAGYKFVWGRYPFGAAWHVLPMVDVAWSY